MRSYKKKIVAIGISAVLLGSLSAQAFADTADDIAWLQQEQAWTQAELDELGSSINSLEDQKAEVIGEIDDLDAQLVTTIALIGSLDTQIAEKEAQLEQTALNLESTKEDQSVQCEAMKKRIQYLYETGGNAGWASILLDGSSLSGVLDKADYTEQMYNYDRQELDDYIESVEKVEALQQEQLEQQSELMVMKREQEEVQANLEVLLADAQEEYEDYETQIADAYDLAAQYQALIEEQNEQIAVLVAIQEEERRRAEEAAAAAAAAAAQQAAAEQAAAQAAAAAAAQNATYAETYADPYTETYTDAGYTEAPAAPAAEQTYAPASGSTGQDIANFALQFVGGSYVWGGNSLTSGVDCSGFVQQVYKNFGYDLSRTSYTQENEGVAVSYADAQPGDIICYGHHVAIYLGDGQIVHAANEELGITTSTNAAYQPITSVRRIVG